MQAGDLRLHMSRRNKKDRDSRSLDDENVAVLGEGNVRFGWLVGHGCLIWLLVRKQPQAAVPEVNEDRTGAKPPGGPVSGKLATQCQRRNQSRTIVAVRTADILPLDFLP
jgi:hypothetical protein